MLLQGNFTGIRSMKNALKLESKRKPSFSGQQPDSE